MEPFACRADRMCKIEKKSEGGNERPKDVSEKGLVGGDIYIGRNMCQSFFFLFLSHTLRYLLIWFNARVIKTLFHVPIAC